MSLQSISSHDQETALTTTFTSTSYALRPLVWVPLKIEPGYRAPLPELLIRVLQTSNKVFGSVSSVSSSASAVCSTLFNAEGCGNDGHEGVPSGGNEEAWKELSDIIGTGTIDIGSGRCLLVSSAEDDELSVLTLSTLVSLNLTPLSPRPMATSSPSSDTASSILRRRSSARTQPPHILSIGSCNNTTPSLLLCGAEEGPPEPHSVHFMRLALGEANVEACKGGVGGEMVDSVGMLLVVRLDRWSSIELSTRRDAVILDIACLYRIRLWVIVAFATSMYR